MRTLIIGCGYVGLALGRELIARRHQVVGLRRSPPADVAEGSGADFEWWQADVSQPESLPERERAFDLVVQCVAAGGGAVEDYRRTYLEGTRHVLDWLAHTPPQRFIYTSSTGVYGQTDGSMVDETSPTEPSSPTADILIATERLLLEAARERRFPAVVLRLSGIYGPGRGYWLRQFLSGEARLEGEGERVLNLIQRDDVVGAVLAARERGEPGAIYNVTDNEPVTQRALFEWLAQRLQRPLPPSVPPDNTPARRRGLTSKRISNRRLREELAYSLRFPTFREGFAAELERRSAADTAG